MTIQQLEYIVALADRGIFVSAAETLGITQSTLSLTVKKLEDELGVVIFDRNSHPVKLTPIGRKVVGLARSVLIGIQKINDVPKSEKEMMSGTVHVAMISTVASILMPGMFKYFTTNWPGISLEAEEMLSESIIKKILQGEVDLGIVNSPVHNSELLEIPLYTEPFLAYVSPKDPAHEKTEIKRSELFDHPVWIINTGVKLFDSCRMDPSKVFSYDKLYEGGRVGVMIRIVNENGGLTIIPETQKSLIMYSQHANIRPIVDPVPTRTISLVFRRDFIHERLLNEIVKSIKTVIPKELHSDFVSKDHIRI